MSNEMITCPWCNSKIYVLYSQVIYDEYDSNAPELRVFSTPEKRDKCLKELRERYSPDLTYSVFRIEYADIDSKETVKEDL